MTLIVGIGAAIVLILVGLLLWTKRSQAAKRNQASQQAALKRAKKRTSDTQAFRAWAAGDIDHDKYTEILDRNAKDRN